MSADTNTSTNANASEVTAASGPRSVRRSRTSRWLRRTDRRSVLVCVAIIAATLAVGIVALGTGPVRLSPVEVTRTLLGLGDGNRLASFVVLDLRLPRVAAAVVIGGALGLSGAIFQSVSRNPLGSPDIIGFTYGATTGGLIVILLIGGSALEVSLGAIGGGLIAATAVYLLAWQQGIRGYRLVLIGIGVSAMLQSVNFYLIVNASLADAARATIWITGSLNDIGWTQVVPVALAMALVIPAALFGNRWLVMLEMGDDTARALGVPVERGRLWLLVTGVAACAVATAAAGPIAFVALAAPQLATRLTRAGGPNLLPSLWMGGLLVPAADLAAQHVGAVSTLPVGVATAVLGGGYLGWVLWQQRERAAG